MRTIILMGGWDSTLFWWDWNRGSQDRIDEATLPITPRLRHQLDQWYAVYSELYHQDNKGPPAEMEKRLLDDKGIEIWNQLQMELAGTYEVLLFSQQFSRPFKNPEELDLERKKPYA